MFEDPATSDIVNLVLMQRILERALIFVTIVGLAIALTFFLRKSAQEISLVDGAAGLRVTALFSMPVFLLLVLVGFSYVVYTAPMAVVFAGPDGRWEVMNLQDGPTVAEAGNNARAAGTGAAPEGALRRKALAFAQRSRGRDTLPGGQLLARLQEGEPAIDITLESLVRNAPSAVEILVRSEEFDWIFDIPSHATALEAAIDERSR